ncbi:hypothetical protein MNBD_GAMMA11-3452 [hydrothermal vent metagenome]|uniref:DUF4007 domain-containing protein n=1 Tax=hydrothermal vent metagenome TaxID=652676 RepID=A0A3B0XC47_9ZZZZ
MKFSSESVAFGRHETFALRYSWLSKGFQNINVFDDEDAVVRLGVGKNMVSSIRYWLRASQLIAPNKPDRPEDIGNLIFDEKNGLDPYLEDEATIWLIHWLLTTNSALATSWFWFFNKYHKPEFTGQELQTALSDFIKENVVDKRRPSAVTIKNDAQLLPRMYAQSKGNGRTPLEEALDSPLSLLGLVTQSAGGRTYQSRPAARPGLPVGIFAFAVSQLMNKRNVTTLPIEELMYSRDDFASPGSIFRLTETDLITKLELMVDYIPDYFDIRETSGIHQLYQLNKIEPFQYINKYYKDIEQTGTKGVAA